MHHKTVLKWSAAVVVGLLAMAACNDETTGPNGKAPPTTPSLLFANGDNFNGTGACLAHDAAFSGYTNGVNGDTTVLAGTTHCVANDVKVAHADLISFSTNGTDFTDYTGQSVSCNEGDSLWVHLHTDIHQTDNSERTDIGLWIAMDGGNARTGTCNHYNLIPPSFSNTDSLGVWNIDSDHCGDMNAADSTSVDIGTIKVLCETATSTSTSLHVGSCIGWTQPGGNQACPQNGTEDALHYRYGTVPGTTSKCNCEGFDIGITVNRSAWLEVVKACDPTNDPGTFDLLIDGSNQFADNVVCGGTTGKQKLSAGTNISPGATHNFGEGDFTTTNYTSSYQCVNRGTSTVRASGSSLGPNDITLQPNDDVVCTYTNVRNRGKIELKKALSPTTDPGLFNLFIKSGATTVASASNVGNGGTTGATTLNIGTYNLSETAGTGTTLGDYTDSGPSCVTRVGGAPVTVTSGNVDLTTNADIVCTITNTRNTGKLELKKALDPTTDPGLFNLFIKSGATTVASASNVGNGGTTSAGGTTLNTGTYNLSETAGTGTSLSDYAESAPVCVNRVGGTPVTVTSNNVTLVKDADVVCTITNTRNTGKLELKKALVPTTSPGKFNLFIKSGATTVASATDVGDGGTTGSGGTVLPTGTYNLSEAAGTGTKLTDFVSSAPVCVTRVGSTPVTVTSGNVSLTTGADIVCTITNTELSTIIIEKEVVGGGTQSFTFTRTLANGSADLGDNPAPTLTNGQSSTSNKRLVTGSYKVCETNLAVGWQDPTAAGYTLTGDGLGNFCTTFTLAAGETKTIHFVNTPPPGGATRTIGYWKNWSSCGQSNGKQYDKAIASGNEAGTLDFYLGSGSSIYSIGTITSLNCTQAVNLLSKNAINGDKRPGDPIYNMVAQLLGAKLNVAAGAGTCSALTTALGDAQTLLTTLGFNGLGSYKGTLTSAQQALANSLNSTLTAYNEGTLGGGCPTGG